MSKSEEQVMHKAALLVAQNVSRPGGRFWYRVRTPGGGFIYIGIINATASGKCSAGLFLDVETCQDFLDGRPCVGAYGHKYDKGERVDDGQDRS